MKSIEVKKKPKPAKKTKHCVQSRCKQEATSQGYCRLHYLANWKHIKFNDQVKAERRLNAYVDRLSKKYPKDYLEKIKEGLESAEKFQKTVTELEIDPTAEGPDTDNEFLEKFMRQIKPGDK